MLLAAAAPLASASPQGTGTYALLTSHGIDLAYDASSVTVHPNIAEPNEVYPTAYPHTLFAWRYLIGGLEGTAPNWVPVFSIEDVSVTLRTAILDGSTPIPVPAQFEATAGDVASPWQALPSADPAELTWVLNSNLPPTPVPESLVYAPVPNGAGEPLTIDMPTWTFPRDTSGPESPPTHYQAVLNLTAHFINLDELPTGFNTTFPNPTEILTYPLTSGPYQNYAPIPGI